MPSLNAPTETISQTLFDQYAAKWLTVVDADNSDLPACFLADDGARILLARFSMQQVVWLLSSVDVQFIKARFLAVATTPDTGPRFALALFATNQQDERLSAYYLALGNSTVAATPPAVSGGIPTELAAIWLEKWATAPQINAALFATPAGPLQGYNFEVKDFIAPLLGGQSFANLELQLSFGLHEYHSAASDDTLTQTFGLLLRVADSQQADDGGYYDMVTPCPPGH
jgi:hypothetical protein